MESFNGNDHLEEGDTGVYYLEAGMLNILKWIGQPLATNIYPSQNPVVPSKKTEELS